MAFSGFASAGNGAFGAASAQNSTSVQGPDLEDIQTEALGFLSLAGEAKVQLLPTRWPSDKLPPPTSSLMSVASSKGLVAAAGPDSFIVATTESVRKSFEGTKAGDSDIRAFQPQLTIPMPMRVSQLAFSADEAYLVLSAEEGGGLAVYEVQALLQGSTQSAFEVSTNGQSLRALLPNPTPETAELFAVVTTDGNLMMANLKERSFIRGSNGEVLKTGVSCVSWSTRGKQLIAGLGDGTAFQMTPEGEGKGVIPRAPSVDANHHVSSLSWLENNVFLIVYTPSKFDDDRAPDSVFQIVNRQLQTSTFTFQKISDPAPPFGLNRSPPHHFITRLKDFGNLQDLLIVASTASIDVGLFSRSKTPLVSDKPADKITGAFTMTEMANDSRRAQLPMTEDMADTSPIGVVVDLSATEKVEKPIPGDEMSESSTPLPSLMVLNNEGILAGWWVVYSESVRQGIAYPGLVAAGNSQQPQAAVAQTSTTAFGNPAGNSPFGQSSAFGAGTGSFGSPGLGSNTASVFGSPGTFGKPQSPWSTSGSTTLAQSTAPALTGSTPATAPVFGTSTFGAPSTFGNAGGLGQRASPWAAAGQSSGSSFVQSSGSGAKPAAPFGSTTTASPFGSTSATSNGASGGGFAAFANKGGFTAMGTPAAGGSIFAQKPAESKPFGSSDNTSTFGGPGKPAANPFGSTETKSLFSGDAPKAANNPFASTNTNSVFGSGAATEKPANPFGAPFKLGSTFTPDGTAKDDLPKPSTTNSDSLFGSGFGSALGDAAKSPATVPETKEADMDDMKDEGEQAGKPEESPTSQEIPVAPGTQFKTDIPPVQDGLFGIPGAKINTPPVASNGASPGFSFSKPAVDSATSVKPLVPAPSTEDASKSDVKIKPEPESDESSKAILSNAPPAPKPAVEPAAPLPPSWIPPVEKSKYADFLPPSDVPGGPAEEEDSAEDDGGEFETDEEEERKDEDNTVSVQKDADESEGFSSGEDVTKDLSESDNAQTPGLTPFASFGGQSQESPVGGLFSKINKPAQQPASKLLFGEIGKGDTPVLPPPKLQASPRSPSPVRDALPNRLTRPDSSRSFSAPSEASQILDARKTASRQQAPPGTAMKSVEEEKRDEDRRREEARVKKETEEAQALIDKEDQLAQEFLQSEIVGTKTLDEFIAHQDYVGHADKDSIPAQVETVYRDINSMIDTLGLNARALASFIKGHREQYKEGGRNKDDLDSDDDWCLVEIEDLTSIVEKELTQELNDGRVIDVPGKLDTCYELQKEQNRLAAKHDDIKRIFAAETDPEHQANARAQPLSAEQLAQQCDLRKEYTEFQRLLSEAEEGLTLLKAKLAGASGVGRVKGATIPTVENVMRTVMKMTAMAEKRSGDIDVLENQMRRMRFSSVSSIGSREGSPFETPTKSRLGGSTFGFSYSPETPTQSPRRLNASLMSSTRSNRHATPPRKKLSGFSEEEKAELRMKAERRDQVKDKLRGALRKSGMKVRGMDED